MALCNESDDQILGSARVGLYTVGIDPQPQHCGVSSKSMLLNDERCVHMHTKQMPHVYCGVLMWTSSFLAAKCFIFDLPSVLNSKMIASTEETNNY
jgi:hypothetical protein